MKTAMLMTTFVGGLGIVAAPAISQTFAERIVETLVSDGFTPLEVETGPTETRVEAVRDGLVVEVVYDSRTGQIIDQETERFNGEVPAGSVVISTSGEDFSDLATDEAGDDDDENDDGGDSDDDDGDDDDGDDEDEYGDDDDDDDHDDDDDD